MHPPKSVFTFVEFKGDVYAGTGYKPRHGQVYRWLGDGNWELVVDIGIVRNIIDTMVVYDDQLFIGSNPYGYSGAACESTIPVLVSSDGNTFDPTAGIPGCCEVGNLLAVDNQLLARVYDHNSGQKYIYLTRTLANTMQHPIVSILRPQLGLQHQSQSFWGKLIVAMAKHWVAPIW